MKTGGDPTENITNSSCSFLGFLGGSDGKKKKKKKKTPAMQETQVQSLDQENSPGEGNGSSLQYSCLENPMDRGA